MTTTEIVVALVIAIGVVGVIMPVLPGTILVAGAIIVWAWETGSMTAVVVAGLAVVVLIIGGFVKYAVPGRQLKASGVPTLTLVVGAVAGIVGFFVVPVIGLVVGFVLGIYVVEWVRLSAAEAWPSTKSAIRAIGLSILIELTAALLAAAIWAIGLAIT